MYIRFSLEKKDGIKSIHALASSLTYQDSFTKYFALFHPPSFFHATLKLTGHGADIDTTTAGGKLILESLPRQLNKQKLVQERTRRSHICCQKTFYTNPCLLVL
jgi:hypothetical protein